MFKIPNTPKQLAISMIELAVVLAIIGSAAMVALPMYTSYMTRSRVASALTVLGSLERVAKTQFEERSTATSITFGGVTFNNNTVTALNISPVVNALYVPPTGIGAVDANSFLVCVYVGKLQIPNYVAPTPGVAGSYSRICRLVTAQANIYTNRCGALNATSTDIPVEYLPGSCQCANVLSGAC